MNSRIGIRSGPRFLIITVLIMALLLNIFLFSCDRARKKTISPPKNVTIAVVQTYFPALIFIARANNYFYNEGLNVTIQLHKSGVTALDALYSGQADLASTAETPVMFAITGGHQLTLLAETFRSDRELSIVARKDRGIVAPSDLRGKKIAVTPGTVREFFLYAYLGVNGISLNEVIISKLPSDKHMAAILSGKVDAVSSWDPQTKELQKELGARGVTFTMTPSHSIAAILSSRPDFLSQNPDAIKGILRALIRAEDFVREKPQESIKTVADAIGIIPEQLSDLWRSENFMVSLNQSLVLALEDESEWAIKNKLTNARKIPNYLDYIYFDSLISVKPEAVRILR